MTFDIAFDPSASMLTDTERANLTSHMQEAGRRWTDHLAIGGPRSIEVLVLIDDIPTANGTSTTSVFIHTDQGRATYEQGVAYELRTSVDPNDDTEDARITVGLDYLRNELWFDPDPQTRTAPVPSDRVDAMSVFLHEFGHVLAYNGFADVQTGTPPDTYWSTFDRWIVAGDAPVFSGPAAVAAWHETEPDLTIGNIFHWGNAGQDNANRSIELCDHGPTFWRAGAPVPRACSTPASADRPMAREGDDAPLGDSLIDQLMNGVVFYRGTRYDISPLDLGVLQDVGLPLNNNVDVIYANGFDFE